VELDYDIGIQLVLHHRGYIEQTILAENYADLNEHPVEEIRDVKRVV
jgi:hypothetical protein